MMRRALLIFRLAAGLSCAAGGCGEKRGTGTTRPVAEHLPKVASLVPAATDLIVAMGAADHLVAVSNYDSVESKSRDLPRVGDYANTDWETLATLRPKVMVIQMDPARLPEGFGRRTDRLGIQLLNVRLNTLGDLLDAIPKLGDAVGEAGPAAALAKRLSVRLGALEAKSRGRSPVKTLLTLDAEGKTLVGGGTFLDDLLAIAGGENAAKPLGAPWPAADAETLMQLKPDVVIFLKPDAKTEALDRAKSTWSRLSGVPAGRSGRIFLIADHGVLLPGAHVADVAEAMERCIHPAEEAGR